MTVRDRIGVRTDARLVDPFVRLSIKNTRHVAVFVLIYRARGERN